jgi:heme/copper-type cytochrome/quinol oxidase subunit 2
MTKGLKIWLILFICSLLAGSIVQPVKAQCAMCTTAVESNAKNGNTTTNGLNNGIMYLLAAPYIAVAAIGYIWYKKYRRKNVNIQMRDERLHLN